MVRKSELQDATWNEVDFENRVWSIPKERMKRAKAHNVYLSEQSMDILIALKTCSGNSRYLLPSRYDADEPMSRATFNRVTAAIVGQATQPAPQAAAAPAAAPAAQPSANAAAPAAR